VIQEILLDISGIPGRMEEIKNNEGFKVFVDYAHTPDALEKVLEDFKNTKGVNNIITVF
jgi:UDP-N-acetylmuramoyl-L-alanyl-D-glutamate--2,6-diaminopimelate ligase